MRVIDADYLRKYFGMDRKGDCSKCRHNENDCGCDRITHLVNICSAIDVAPTIDAESMTYKWHDLRKDPNDLPEDYYSVLICLKGFEGMRAGVGIALHNRKNGLWGTSTFTYKDEDVIAWREIEPFEVDE